VSGTVNFTVSIPEELKTEMEKYPDVNWSNLIRKNIQNYLQNRRNTFPPLEFELKEVHLAYSNELMQPLMILDLKVAKSLDSQIIIDRISFNVKFVKEHFVQHGEDYLVVAARDKKALAGVFKEVLLDYLHIIKSVSDVKMSLSPSVDMLRRLNDNIHASFWVDISITAYAQGFEYPAIKNLTIKVPIDEWKNELTNALNSYDKDWIQGRQ
jgi:hypothetical protein